MACPQKVHNRNITYLGALPWPSVGFGLGNLGQFYNAGQSYK